LIDRLANLMKTLSYICLAVFVPLLGESLSAQTSAPSSHMVFDDHFPGDIIINQVRVPMDGEAMYTYYEALGWRGLGAGYAGIQAHPKAHNFIFSIWDHKAHTAPIKAVHHGPGTETKGFGGEGTGLKSWNFELGWKKGIWYTLVARSWPVGDHTYFAFWARAGDTKKWTHLVTMDVGAKNALFEGRTDAFIEDWLNTGAHPRTTHLRNGWKRKKDGSWFPFGSGRYSVNSWDLVEGKRSYNFRTNWNGGIAKDAEGEFYFMTSGGKETVAEVKNPSNHILKRKESKPAFDPVAIEKLNAKWNNSTNSLDVTWKVKETDSPQFSYLIEIFNDEKCEGNPLFSIQENVPHQRSYNVSLDKNDTYSGKYLKVHLTDIFDQQGKPIIQKIIQ
jgi:hypothetical protein